MTTAWRGLIIVSQWDSRSRLNRQLEHCSSANQNLCFSQIPIPRAQSQRCSSFQSPNNNRTQSHQSPCCLRLRLFKISRYSFFLLFQDSHAFNEKLLPREHMVKSEEQRCHGGSYFWFSRPTSSQSERKGGRCFELWWAFVSGRYRKWNKFSSFYVSYSGSFQEIELFVFFLWHSNGTFGTG